MSRKSSSQTFKRIGEFEARGAGSLHAYLRQAVLNRIRDERRRGGRRLEDTDLDTEGPGEGRFFALVYAGLGENREALNWLEKAYEERSGSIRYLKVEPRLNGLRGEPQMQDMMRRVGLADK